MAIAGVLAMEPEVLILDEPTAGLDPRGRDEILDQIAMLHEERKFRWYWFHTVWKISQKYVERMIVMNKGESI